MNAIVFLFPAVVFYLFWRHWAKPPEKEPERPYVSESDVALPEVMELMRSSALEPGSCQRDAYVQRLSKVRPGGRRKVKTAPPCCLCNFPVDRVFVASPILHIGQRNVHLPCSQKLIQLFLTERYALFASLDVVPRDIVIYTFTLAAQLCITPVLHYTLRCDKDTDKETLRRALQRSGVLIDTVATFDETWFMIYCSAEQYKYLRALEFDLVPYGK